MGRRLVPVTIIAAVLAFATSAVSTGYVVGRPEMWQGALALVVISGVTPMIFAVNVRILPVFSGRQWQSPRLLYSTLIVAVSAGWGIYLARLFSSATVEYIFRAAALLAVGLFILNVAQLFRSPRTAAPPPPPVAEQASIDHIGTGFIRLSALYLLVGAIVGLVLMFWTPEQGRWDLVWAHLMLVGWFVSMASGVLYHVLPRWTGAWWRRPRLIRVHFLTLLFGLPAMIAALAFNFSGLFAIAGPLQAIAILLLVWNIWPLASKLPGITRYGICAAAVFLALGVTLGASVAMDPANHVNLRFSHAQINLFGWGGLLVSGMGYYLFPRFAGQPLRWPHLAKIQLALLTAGVVIGAASWWWYLAVDTSARPFITAGSWLIGTSFVLYATLIATTFFSRRGNLASITVQTLRPGTRPMQKV